MRIAYHTDTREIGGAEQNLIDMARAAVSLGHEVALLAPQRELVEWISARVPGAQAVLVGHDDYFDAPSQMRRGYLLLSQMRTLACWLRRERIELVHVNNGGFPGSDLCRLAPLAARLAGVPRRIMTVHSNPWPRVRSGNEHIQTVLDGLVWPNVETITCPSHAVLEGLMERREAPRRLLRLLHYGVSPPGDPDLDDVRELRRRLTPDGALLVGMVSARPVPEKGYDVFVDALARTTRQVRGVLIGPIPPADFAERATQRVGDRLVLEGEVRPVSAHYHACDLTVVPSTGEECMPLVILEAMAAARPVVGSGLSGIPEAIVDGETGWLFSPGDSRELAAILDQAATCMDALRLMGLAGRARWEELFRPEVMVANLRRIYDA